MDSTTIIERIKNVELLKNDNSEVWDNITDEFPYFSCAQWLKYGNRSLNGAFQLKPVFLYKSEPLEFARYNLLLEDSKVIQVSESNISKLEKESKTEIFTTQQPAETVNLAASSVEPILETSIEPLVDEMNVLSVNSDMVGNKQKQEEKVAVQIQSVEKNPDSRFSPKENEIDLTSSAETTPNETPLEVKTIEVQSDNVSANEDILELINELPNSAPFELNDVLHTKHKVVEVKISNLSDKILSSANTEFSQKPIANTEYDEDKSLLVVMSFTEWLNHFKHKTEVEKKEAKEKKALKAAWQKEKLAEAADEELDEIPEPLFKQAMDSISMESSLISEALAEILAKQGKKDKAISMYKKLSLRNPEKSTYFADLINELNLNFE